MKPNYWKTRIDEVNEVLFRVKKGTVSILTTTGSGREIPMVTYGPKEDFNRTANYNSACGAKDRIHYADKTGKQNVVLVVGGIHANEYEGIASTLNFINIIETGEDLLGKKHELPVDVTTQTRLIIIPLMNMDGRARLPMDTFLGISREEAVNYAMGMFHDGRSFLWPYCKRIHPVPLKDLARLGSYFNDNGINFMHDDFFGEMQNETKALFKLTDAEAPDFILLLHSGGDMPSTPMALSYVPMFINEKLMELSLRVKIRADALGLRCGVDPLVDPRFSYPAHTFNLTSALHHTCGGVPTTYESESVASEDMYEKILNVHRLLFEEALTLERALD